jgi:two-component system response regulator FixJ
MASESSEVLIVDDDHAVRTSLSKLMELEGFRTRSYESAQAFLDDVDAETVGVLILDVRLPDISGLEVQRRLIEMGSRLAVIVVTGHGDVPMAVTAMKEGAFNFIEKPFVGDGIIEAVREAESQLSRSADDAVKRESVIAKLETLTARERDVLDKLILGFQNKMIAHELGISPRTVEIHRARVMQKMQARSLSHLVRMALQSGVSGDN